MLLGVKFKANPTIEQKKILSQWMGCAKTIWNAKCEDERYMTRFARNYYPIGTYAPIDQAYSQYKDPELTPWLSECPSQILRNSAVNWYSTYCNFMQGKCGKPKRKKKSNTGSIHLTRELFRFDQCEDNVTRLWIGSKKNNIGYLSFKRHKNFKAPNSIYIRKENGNYYISFCYGEAGKSEYLHNKGKLKKLKKRKLGYLKQHIVGIDRGVHIPVQANDDSYDFAPEQKKNKSNHEKYIKRLQKKLSRQVKGSVRYKKTKHRLSVRHNKIANIRNDFCHKVSHSIVNKGQNKIIILEDLKTKNMSKRPEVKINEQGHYLPNKAKAKAGLNKSILDKAWHKLERYISYKAQKKDKAFFKVSAQFTSQECAACGHIHPDNRKQQKSFVCIECGHSDNADRNAAMVIKKRAINMILHSGTELSNRCVLKTTKLDIGQGAKRNSSKDKSSGVVGCELLKKRCG